MPTLRSKRFHKILEINDLGAGATYYKNFAESPEMSKELPFNNIVIRNFSQRRLKVSYGVDTVVIVGASEVFQDDSAYGMRDLKITNLDTLNANDDIIYYQVSRVVSGEHASIATATGENILEIANGDM